MTRPSSIALDFRNTNCLWASVLVETLHRLGLRQAVISPGSRSAPLATALVRHPGIESIPVLDERSAAFFAVGLAKRQRRPVALVCTSGSAGANYFPAVIEAEESGVPLLVLTADRPPEMRACRSGQTIDQQKLFGSHVRFYHELAVPVGTLPMLRYLRQTAAHAWERTLQPAWGPVHLNCPFRDPLAPVSEKLPANISESAFAGFFSGLADADLPGGASEGPRGGPTWPNLTQESRGVIVVGPVETPAGHAFARSVGRLSRALGWPVLADALGPVRMHAGSAGHVVGHYDAILRNEPQAAALRPRKVICLGGWPTSKVLRAWLQHSDPETVIVTDREDNLDALHLRSRYLRGDLPAWAQGFTGRRRMTGYTRQWMDAERRVRSFLTARFRSVDDLIEPKCTRLLARHAPARTSFFVANSMPVRDVEYFWPASDRAQQIFFNRGANGIDGTLSTALGIAHGQPPAILLTGDLALLHDSNGFLLRPKFKGSLTVVLINNEGGGIFEHLPVAQFNPPFEEFFATPQKADFGKLCAAHGVKHVRVRNWKHFASLVANLPSRGIRVLEVPTDRKRDAAFRQELFARLAKPAG